MSVISSLQIGNNTLRMKDNFPSDRYIDITLRGSGTKYTAPADGWITFQSNLSGSNTFFNVHIGLIGSCLSQYTGGGKVPNGITLPISKGQTAEFIYNCSIADFQYCRFVYSKSSLE